MSRKKLNSASNDATMYKQSEVEPLFAMVKTEEGIILCCGKFRVSTQKFKTYEEAEAYIATKPYELLINTAVLFIKLNLDNETKNENPQDK